MLNLSAVNDNKDIATKEYVDGKAAVTGVKGNSESSYRTGNVNLTAAHIGAAPTSHASTGTTYGLGNASNYGHVKLSSVTNGTAGDSGGIAATPLAVSTVEKRIVSRGENLIINGNGFMGDNTNFSQLTFDGSQSNGSPASFTKSVSALTVNSDDLFPVDISKDYLCEFDVKAADPGAQMYAMLLYYDVDKYNINIQMVSYIDGSTTTLARELKNGDTKVYLTDASGFQDTSYDHQRSLIIWDYTNSFGYTYPAETYSRNYYVNKWSSNSAVDKTNNVITLSSAWTGGTHVAGTPVSQNTSGSTYCYFWYHTNISTFPRVWTHVRAVCSGTKTVGLPSGYGVKFWAGTAYCRVGFLWNYQANNNQGQIWATNISVKEDVKAGSLRDTGNANAITAQYSGSGITSTSWLAAWSGYKICAISPNNVTIGKAKQLVPETIRPTSANPAATSTAALTHYLATTSMTTGKPMTDGHIIEADWDNTGGWKSQLFIPNQSVNTSNHLQWRAQNGTTGWGNWITVLDANSTIDASTVGGHTVGVNVPANAVFTDTDTKVKQTSKTSGTYPLMLTGVTSPTSGNAAEANYNTNVKVDTSAGNLQATKFNGLTLTAASTGFTIAGGTTSKTLTVNNTYTLAAACAKGVDTSISSGSTSTNLPTTAAVASYVSSQAGSDTKATQTGTNTSGNYPLLFKNTANTTDETAAVRYGNTSGKLVTINPSSGNINASSFNGITITDDGADGIFIASAEGSIVVEGGNDFTLGSACEKGIGSVTSGNTGLVTGGDVYTAIQNAGGGGGRVATYYTTCSTAAGTAAKVITISGYTPQAGDVLTVYFSTANTANAPTINLNSTGAKAIYIGSAAASATNQLLWSAGDTLMFVYSGSYWYFVSRAKGDTFTTLYNNTTGTNGTVTLSSSAANFDHMRIYFKKSSGQNGCGSVDVYSPNGKYVNLTIFEPDSGSAYLWFASRTVYINGTSISTYGSAVGGAIGASTSCGSNTELNIIRVEAWK